IICGLCLSTTVPPPTISNNMLTTTAMTPSTTSLATHSICLLSGPLGEFLQYSRQEASKWLIDLAHDIAILPISMESQQHWCPVANTDPLAVSIYCYNLLVGITVSLSKISHRVRKSVTTTTRNTSTMADHGTAVDDPLANSHICLKHMGDHIGLSEMLDAWFDKYQMGLLLLLSSLKFPLINCLEQLQVPYVRYRNS
ncbi:hypothetical protein C8R44DRAFT_813793, partial [Mycena epipterygia]